MSVWSTHEPYDKRFKFQTFQFCLRKLLCAIYFLLIYIFDSHFVLFLTLDLLYRLYKTIVIFYNDLNVLHIITVRIDSSMLHSTTSTFITNVLSRIAVTPHLGDTKTILLTRVKNMSFKSLHPFWNRPHLRKDMSHNSRQMKITSRVSEYHVH